MRWGCFMCTGDAKLTNRRENLTKECLTNQYLAGYNDACKMHKNEQRRIESKMFMQELELLNSIIQIAEQDNADLRRFASERIVKRIMDDRERYESERNITAL